MLLCIIVSSLKIFTLQRAEVYSYFRTSQDGSKIAIKYFCTLECGTRPKIGAKSSHCNIFLSRFRRETAPRQCETGYLIQLSDRCTELREYLGFCRGIGWIGHIGIYN